VFGPDGGAQHKCDTRNINDTGNNNCTDVFPDLDADFCPFSPEVEATKIDNISSIIYRRMYSSGTDQVMAQPYNDQGC